MESLPYDNLDELAQYLQLTFSGKTEDIQKATRIFTEMSQNITHLFDSLIFVIVNDRSDQEFTKIKNAACLVMASNIPIVVRTQNISLETRSYLANALINTIFLENVSLPLKLTLQTVIKALYNADTKLKIVGALLRNQGLLIVKEKLSSENMNDCASTLLILQAIINTQQTPSAIVEWFVELKEQIMVSGNNIINGIVTEIEDLLRGNGNQKEKVTSICIGLRILNIWIMLIHDILKSLSEADQKSRIVTQYVEVIINDELLINRFSNILTIQLPTNQQIEQCLFSTSGVSEIDELLNVVKMLVLKEFNYFLGLINKSKSQVKLFQTRFYSFIQDNCINGVLNSVFVFCKSDMINIETALKNRALNNCVVECLVFLTNLTSHDKINKIFSSYKKQLLLDVCLPLIRSPEAELLMFQNDWSQFINLAGDTCYEQESKIVKTQAAQLLERLCRDVHGALSYLVIMLINVMEYSLVCNIPEELPLKYESLDARAKFITQTDSRIRVETSLIALSTIDYQVANRPDLMDLLEKLLTTYQQYFFGSSSDAFVKSRTCLFIEHYIDTLFQEEEKEEMFKTLLKFVVECVGCQSPEYGALPEQALDALSFIFQEKGLTIKLSPFVNDILQQLIFYTKVIRSSKFYEILVEIVKYYSHHLRQNPTLLGNFLEVLVERVQFEYENYKQNKNFKKILIHRVWGIFILIAENKLFMNNFQEDIERILSPLFAYLSTDKDVIFEDDVMRYMISAIKLSKRVSNACWEIFKACPIIFMQAQTISNLMFKALNQVIIHGRNVLENDATAVKALIDMGIHTLKFSQLKDDNFDICKGALLLQLVIQYLGNISNEDWNSILGVCTDMLFQVQQDFIKTKLGGIILCMFLTNFELTQAILSNKNALGDVLKLFLKDTLSFEGNPYDRKVLIVGLCSFLAQRDLNPLIYENLPLILEVLVSLLKFIQVTDEEKRRQKVKNPEKFKDPDISKADFEKLKKFLADPNCNMEKEAENMECIPNENEFSAPEEEKESYDSNETESEDSNPDIFTDFVDLAETNTLVNEMETELKQKDEFLIFQDYFLKMKDNDNARTMEIIDKLPKEKKEFLRVTLQSKRIFINPNEGKSEARRIVKPKARKVATNLNDSD